MRIQLKLFVLLLVIAIVPLVALSWRSQRATQDLGQSLASFGRAAVTQEIETQLSQAVGYSADLLASQQRQVELALRLQAGEASARLAPPEAGAAVIYRDTDFDAPGHWPPGTELALDHAIASPGRELQATPISREHQSFFVPAGGDDQEARRDMARLASMDQAYRQLSDANPNLFYWQYVSLANGVLSSYPGHGAFPQGYDPRNRAWYKDAVARDGLVWSAALLDASTRRLLLTASQPFRGRTGEIGGVAGIDIDILGLLNTIQSRVRVGKDAESFIVQLVDDNRTTPQLRVIASSTYKDSGAAWNVALQTQALTPDAGADFATLIDDLRAGRDGIRQLPYHGRPALWAYGRLESLGSALLYIVPVDAIASIADSAQTSVRQAILEQVRLAGFASLGLIAIVAALAVVAARSVTSPLRSLAAAAKDLAGGNLEAQAPVESADEVGELAQVFNAMVPELRNHISVKESLSLAREVQQKLLPDSAPQVPGFDIAGRSVYSEAIGGDYYDFMTMSGENGHPRYGVVVGDVSGHGVVAALTMMSVRALLRSYAGDGSTLRPVMRAVNRHLSADTTAGRFVTLVYMVIAPESRHVRWISAGHGPILFYDIRNHRFEELAVHDIPLGVKADWPFHENDREIWPPEGLIVIGTDGLWETLNAAGEAFGREGLMAVLRATSALTAAEICAQVIERVRAFAGNVPQADDMTVVVIKFTPP
ncbi:MAG: SpoIIE family protein phosphatase [Rhodospirillaceae bacterium]